MTPNPQASLISDWLWVWKAGRTADDLPACLAFTHCDLDFGVSVCAGVKICLPVMVLLMKTRRLLCYQILQMLLVGVLVVVRRIFRGTDTFKAILVV